MQNQRIMSFDVGIKNLAYCIFEVYDSEKPFQITDWNVLNLMEKEEPSVLCSCRSKKEKEKEKEKEKTKKPKKVVVLENFFLDSSSNTIQQIKLCTKVAKYKKNGIFYCEKHAKTQSEYMIPKKQITISQLKKKKMEELLKICLEYKLLEGKGETDKTPKKQVILDLLETFFKTKSLESIVESKKVTAGDTDLIVIGKNMKTLLNLVKDIELVTHVIIENQISPIANRMKTVQGMLAQYFIMKNTDIKIDFVSSANKLKGFSKPEDKKETDKTDKQKYKKHKSDGVFYTNQILEKNEWLSKWRSHMMESKKKDDLADCFLQGIWFLKSRDWIQNNIINYLLE